MTEDRIVLDHGSGAKLSRLLVEHIAKVLEEVYLGEMEDSACLPLLAPQIAVTTDSFVVTPLFFGGGDIGKIAVCGTVNDLAVSGATPKYLTLSLVVEAGFRIDELNVILESVRNTALEAGVKIVAGDTKVVDRGEVDKLFINTAGIGELHHPPLSMRNIKPGDRIILSGNIGDHSIHLLSLRAGLGFEQRVPSDCAPLNGMIAQLLGNDIGSTIKCMRDVTRGGLASVLHEFVRSCGFSMYVEESKLPLREETVMAADMLGINPIYLANEGCLCLIVAPVTASEVVTLLREHPYGRNAVDIGWVSDTAGGELMMQDNEGNLHRIEELTGQELPRLC